MNKKSKTRISQIEKYFRRYLQISPLGLALWRSIEAKHLAGTELIHPVLDIGCGFGEFAVAFADEPIDMGVDICAKDLYAASKTKKYKNLTLADARDLPFSDNSYGSIFSISTLEHIDNADKALKEAYRILKPGGVLFLTLETDEVDAATFYRPFFQKIGFPTLSSLATKGYNSLFHRQTLLPKKEWIKKVKKAGFRIDKSQNIISTKVTRLFDLLLITAWPSQLFRPLIGKRVVFRPKFMEDLLVKIFLKYISVEEKEGTNLLVIARKPR
ncbi:class I SAM-dependent methyltransferase [Patescibacteria group bacterium]|nr:class I SAM-dependent methyltransferase [Patescibacteria group bacterium]MBU4016661.1 class I SAM-dependent methyltransferase [Patescibacteria group bacterium]MBU4099547.1 class I SAM-dependent methyltransferase [Patescibacteria group bacterium]